MKKYFILLIALIVTLSVTGCGTSESKSSKKGKIESCPNCVYVYSEDEIDIGDKLENYTDDYNTLKTPEGAQRNYFLGYNIDSNDIITNTYACGINNEKVFCIESSDLYQNDEYEKNIKYLKKIYGSDNCKEENDRFLCSTENSNFNIDKFGSISISGKSITSYCYVFLGNTFCR